MPARVTCAPGSSVKKPLRIPSHTDYCKGAARGVTKPVNLSSERGVRQRHRGAGFPHFFKGPRGKRGRFPGPTRWPKALVNKGIH